MTSRELNGIAAVRGGLIVTCQCDSGEPFHDSPSMVEFASSALAAGAVGIGAQGLGDIALMNQRIPLPQIGLWKRSDIDGVFITPTLEHAIAVAVAGAEINALDGTRRTRPNGRTLRETIDALHERTTTLVMADTAAVSDAEGVVEAGAVMISTALSGYTHDTRARHDEPDFDLVLTLAAIFSAPVFAEGRIRMPEQAAEAIALGAYAVVVGAAITDPIRISSWLVDAIRSTTKSCSSGGARTAIE